MKKFARYFLVWIILSILSGVGGYFFLQNYYIAPVYESVSEIYVVTGADSEAALRATDGGLKEDFSIVFKSVDVIAAAQRNAGTTEDLASYITVNTPANSNVIEVICQNPDQTTAKKYVDALVASALKSTSIIPVSKMSVISAGTSTGIAVRPNLYRYTLVVAGLAASGWFFLELIIGMTICAFKKKADDDDEADYYRYYGSDAPKYEKGDKVPEAEKRSKKNEKEIEQKNSKKDINDKLAEDDEDDDLDLEETDIMEVDILSDVEEEPKSEIINVESSSEVIGRIPR